MEIGKRYNNGKLDWRLLKLKDLEPLIEVLMFGKEKYGEGNWKKGLPISDILNSATRHLSKFELGIDIDEESLLQESGHLMCNIYFASWLIKNKPWFDDRPNSSFSKNIKPSTGVKFDHWCFNFMLQCDRHGLIQTIEDAEKYYEEDRTVLESINLLIEK